LSPPPPSLLALLLAGLVECGARCPWNVLQRIELDETVAEFLQSALLVWCLLKLGIDTHALFLGLLQLTDQILTMLVGSKLSETCGYRYLLYLNFSEVI
jgi:hypothetical protein